MRLEAQDRLYDKLGDYVEDTLALEEGVVDNLDSMIRSLDDETLIQMLERHRQVGREHAERLKRRLELLDRGDTPIRKRIEGMAVSLVKGVSDAVRTDAPGKVGRDAYLLAHSQIAAYELLGRLATSVGDDEAVELARTHLADERMCAEEISAHWDMFFNETLVGWLEEEPASADEVGRLT
jgi:ferritin-like metal-binding protein YciE